MSAPGGADPLVLRSYGESNVDGILDFLLGNDDFPGRRLFG
jgi:hypothetical protein